MTTRPAQIIALGGGGFGSEPDNPALDLFILDQTRRPSPKICFIPTASGDNPAYIDAFRGAFSRYDCRPSVLQFFDRTPDLRPLILGQDAIFVGGGNTKSMLALWRDWGLVELLREAWKAGIVLAGVSAGAICWFEQGLTDSVAGDLTVLDCLALLDGPHYDGETDRRPFYHRYVVEGRIRPGIALDDGAAAHFVDGRLRQVVSSRPKAKAYRVSGKNGAAVENPIDALPGRCSMSLFRPRTAGKLAGVLYPGLDRRDMPILLCQVWPVLF